MSAIWRFDFPVDAIANVSMPKGARILPHVEQRAAGKLSVWAEVDSSAEPEVRVLRVVGTGNPFDSQGLAYVGTTQQGPFVWHVYQEVAS